MAVIYSTEVANNRLAVTRDAIDAGGGPGKLQIGNLGFGTVLAELTLQDPCGFIMNRVLTFTPPPLLSGGAADGSAVAARFVDSNGVVVISGLTVGTAGTDILLSSTTITTGEPVELLSATLTHG